MRRFILIIISFVTFTNTTEAQTDDKKFDCIENNQVCNYLIENGDTIWKNCVVPYFPINDYLNYGEDCFELYWLYKYSFLLHAIDEKVLFKENKNFTRILLLKAKMSKLILIERNDSHLNITNYGKHKLLIPVGTIEVINYYEPQKYGEIVLV